MSQLDHLTQTNINDLVAAFGLQHLTYGRRFIRALCWWPARNFAKLMLKADRHVGEIGLAAGANVVLRRFTQEVTVSGGEHIPSEGPVVILSNHPGLADTMALFANIPRHDLRTISLRRPFLEALPEMKRHLIFINEDRSNHYQSLHQIINHLKQGGAILTFPAGKIEPDPAVKGGAKESLETWANTVAMFARLSTNPVIVPALVSGVVSVQAQRNPLTKLRKKPVDQEWLGATLQVLWPLYHKVRVHVQFGPPLPAEILRNTDDANGVFKLFRTHIIPLIDRVTQPSTFPTKSKL